MKSWKMKKDLLYDWKIDCQIYADWSTYQYILVGEDDFSSESLYIDLPGKKARIAAKQLIN